MGKRDGGLLSEWCGGITAIDQLIELYPQLNIDDPINSFLFGINDLYSTEYYITFTASGKHFITSNFDEDYNTDGLAENFEKLLFQIAFEKYEQKYFKEVFHFRNGRKEYEASGLNHVTNDRFSEVTRCADRFLLKKVWFSDKWHYIACNNDCTMYVKVNYAVEGFIAGKSKADIEQIGNEICELLEQNPWCMLPQR